MALIKDIYHKAFYERLAASLEKVVPGFQSKKFMAMILPDAFYGMEWKERMQHTTTVLHQFMPADYAASAALMGPMIEQLKNDGFSGGLEFMFLPAYIATYGLADFERSVIALELVTQYISAEFAVRPFLLKYHEPMMAQMLKWSTHNNHHVRRFASEGSRPRLPWGAAIPALKADPRLILPILENLKHDQSEYVRRSVANNLNDIAKDNPAVVIALAKAWRGISKETDALVKHACRTLLKSGHEEILDLYGLSAKHLAVEAFEIITPRVKLGEALSFSFHILNNDEVKRYIRLEYTVYYLKNNGSLAGKVFKISEKDHAAGTSTPIKRKQSFKLITTRKFYAGMHQLSIVVNGKEMGIASFELVE